MTSENRPSWTPERTQEAVRLRRERKTFQQIGDLMGCSLMDVYSHLRKVNGTVRKPKMRRKAQRKINTIPCLCCRKPFQSQGPHNRLCRRCREKDVSPFTPF